MAVTVLLAACAGRVMEETVVNARPMEGSRSAIAWGDCAEARRRAQADPELDVDSVPRPVSQRPAPFAKIPAAVVREINAKGSVVKVNVLVDTLGRPVMKTFTVVESSHPWLAENLRAAIPSWRFRAARLAGCRVPRMYRFSATSRARRS